MKNYFLIIIMLGLFTNLMAQTVPTNTLRIQNATTALGQNIPVGTHVYDMANQQTFVATTGVATGETLTSAAASFKLVSTAVVDNVTSNSTTAALSANQGMLLQDGKLDKTQAFTGDVTGTYDNNTVSKIGGYAVDLSTAPTDNQVLKWNATDNEWQAAVDAMYHAPLDRLDSYSAVEALSANQGRILNEEKAAKNNVLELDNSTAFYPTSPFQPATKKYVDDELGDYIPHSLLSAGKILIGNTIAGTPPLNYATARDLSGDATLANDGTITIEDDAVDGSDIELASEAAGDVMFNDGTDWIRLPAGTAGQVLAMNAAGTAPEWITPSSSGGPSKRIGEFVYAKTGKTAADGYLAVTSGTVTNGAIDYPLWAAQYPEFVSGNDIVFPADVAGMFLRNLGGNAAAEGSYQEYRTARPTTAGFVTNSAGNHSHNFAGSSGDTGESNGYFVMMDNTEYIGNRSTQNSGNHSHQINSGGDVETNPRNRAYQLYTIVDTY